MIRPGHRADDTHAFFNKIDGRALQFECVKSADVALQAEAAPLPHQHATFVDWLAQSVASIARAAASGSSAWVMGRPMTSMDAP